MVEKTNSQALIIFVKNAELGKVKTRIAQTAGNKRALKIYKALLQHTKEIALSFKGERFLFYSERIEHEDDWSSKDFHKHLQEGTGLGERMTNAFFKVMQSHQPAIIIGSDCASLTPEIIKEAFTQLENYDFVIGPAKDGGYYLLGMNQLSPYIFLDIDWSTNKVAQQTLAKITAQDKNHYLLPTLSDIDYEEDWKKYGWPIE